jgi:hypothetical protein
MPRFFSEMGPNFYAMALFAIVAFVLVGRSLRAVHWGREARTWPLVVGMSIPLLFSVYASTMQFDTWSVWVERVYGGPGADPLAYETMTAMVLSKAVHTQMAAGLVTGAASLALIIGVIALTVEGDHPRLGIGSVSVALTAGLVLTAAVSGLYMGPLGAALRAGLYLAGGIAATTGLLAAHSRGPGVQAGTLTSQSSPRAPRSGRASPRSRTTSRRCSPSPRYTWDLQWDWGCSARSLPVATSRSSRDVTPTRWSSAPPSVACQSAT